VQSSIQLENVLPAGAAALPRSQRVRRQLERRGVSLAPLSGESLADFSARLETGLMALFRDSRGEEEFAALYEVAGQGVLRNILMGLRGQSARLDPQELCQDVFVNIYRYAASFRDDHPRSFKAWVHAISRNLIRRHMGTRRRPSLQALPEGLAEPEDGRVGPSACASLCEERESLLRSWSLLLLHYAAAWEQLSERDQAALTLVEVDGLSYTQACDVLGVGMSNMKMIMFRARKRLRAHLSLALEGGEPREPQRLVG
jgi:RNA polymerase sigma-70 factor (ECF subfamily)